MTELSSSGQLDLDQANPLADNSNFFLLREKENRIILPSFVYVNMTITQLIKNIHAVYCTKYELDMVILTFNTWM